MNNILLVILMSTIKVPIVHTRTTLKVQYIATAIITPHFQWLRSEASFSEEKLLHLMMWNQTQWQCSDGPGIPVPNKSFHWHLRLSSLTIWFKEKDSWCLDSFLKLYFTNPKLGGFGTSPCTLTIRTSRRSYWVPKKNILDRVWSKYLNLYHLQWLSSQYPLVHIIPYLSNYHMYICWQT